VSDPVPFDPERLITALHRHGVRYVLIGALAARLQGFPRLTADADITPARDRANLERLATALRELDARIFTESVPEGLAFDCSAAMLDRAALWNLTTSAGRLDIAFEPSGTGGFDDLAPGAVRFDVFGVELLAASLVDIIRSKEAADRPQDRYDVIVLREMLRRDALLIGSAGFAFGVGVGPEGPGGLNRLSLRELESIPVDTTAVQLRAVEYEHDDKREGLPLAPYDGFIANDVAGGRGFGPIRLKSLLKLVHVDRIPAAPQRVYASGTRTPGTVAVAVVVSDRLYPQVGADTAARSSKFDLPIQLGREGIAEFGSSEARFSASGSRDPFIVGGGVGGIYALSVVSVRGNVAFARTPFFLFKRTNPYPQ